MAAILVLVTKLGQNAYSQSNILESEGLTSYIIDVLGVLTIEVDAFQVLGE